MEFCYILNDEHDPAYNLALEEILFVDAVRTRAGFLMLWMNDPVVVVGRYQNTAEEVNSEYTRALGVRVVRRMTGGGAVYHDRGNLNYTIIAPSRESSLDVKSFAVPLLEFLRSLGVDGELSGRNDVTVDGRKISGVAQYTRSGIVLHHGTVLFDSRLEDVGKALNVRAEKFESKGFKSVRSRVTNVRPFLKNTMTIEEFRESFAKFLREYYGARTVRPPTDEETALAFSLAASKYGTEAWTWGQSPPFTVRLSRRFAAGTVQLGLVVTEGRVTEARVLGDFFSADGVESVENALKGIPYPFADLRATLTDELLEGAFSGIDPEHIREFFAR